MKGLELRDSLLADAVAEQRSNGEVDVRGTSDYIVEVLRQMDRKATDRKTGHTPSTKKPDAVGKEFEKRSGSSPDKWKVDRSLRLADTDKLRQKGYRRLQQRLRWIRSKPDLRREFEALSAALVAGKRDARERAAEKMRQLLDKSDRLYGREWWKSEPRRIWSS